MKSYQNLKQILLCNQRGVGYLCILESPDVWCGRQILFIGHLGLSNPIQRSKMSSDKAVSFPWVTSILQGHDRSLQDEFVTSLSNRRHQHMWGFTYTIYWRILSLSDHITIKY